MSTTNNDNHDSSDQYYQQPTTITCPLINPTNQLHLIDDQYNQQWIINNWSSIQPQPTTMFDWSSQQPTTTLDLSSIQQQQRTDNKQQHWIVIDTTNAQPQLSTIGLVIKTTNNRQPTKMFNWWSIHSTTNIGEPTTTLDWLSIQSTTLNHNQQ